MWRYFFVLASSCVISGIMYIPLITFLYPSGLCVRVRFALSWWLIFQIMTGILYYISIYLYRINIIDPSGVLERKACTVKIRPMWVLATWWHCSFHTPNNLIYWYNINGICVLCEGFFVIYNIRMNYKIHLVHLCLVQYVTRYIFVANGLCLLVQNRTGLFVNLF